MPWKNPVHQSVPKVDVSRAKAKQRVSRSLRGYTHEWDVASRMFLQENPLCVRCLSDDEITPSQVTDHIIPHKGDMSLFWDRANWQALCKRHHDVKTATEDGGFGVR